MLGIIHNVIVKYGIMQSSSREKLLVNLAFTNILPSQIPIETF